MNTCTEGQPFGGNYSPLYSAKGLVGHPGQDWSCGWGTPIVSRYAGFAYKVFSVANTPNRDGYTEVDLIVDDGLECFEWLVGHLDPTIETGTVVHQGAIIGTEANHGPVYSGNIQITVAMQKAGDQRGHHRHYQKRPVQRIDAPSGHMLIGPDGKPYRDAAGHYYRIWDYDNGYNGCTDATLAVFNRMMQAGDTGYDVYVMQRILQRAGWLTVEPTGFFGEHTTTALMQYQNAKSLPMVGYAGPTTRAALSQELEALPDLSHA